MQYKKVVEELTKLGFSNIHLFRNNDLVTGVVDSEGSISAFYIDGKKGFTEGESFYRDTLIEIVVNTKNKGCEDIVEYREKSVYYHYKKSD